MSKDVGWSDSKADRQGSQNRELEAEIERLELELELMRNRVKQLKKKTGYTTSLFDSVCNNCGHRDSD